MRSFRDRTLAKAYENLGKAHLAYEAIMDAIAHQPSLALDFAEQLKALREQMVA